MCHSTPPNQLSLQPAVNHYHLVLPLQNPATKHCPAIRKTRYIVLYHFSCFSTSSSQPNTYRTCHNRTVLRAASSVNPNCCALPIMPTQQPLASKDAALFRQVMKCYEQKQYKKGLKACEVSRIPLLTPSGYQLLTLIGSKSYEKTLSMAKP